jgi:hypothetical protein
MTIELSAQLESALAYEAARRGITPQALAVHLIEAHLIDAQLPAGNAERKHAAGNGTMLDRWREHLDSLPPPSKEARPDWLRSDNASEAFAKILEERRRDGR